MQVILSYSYRCRCGNCALNHLQNAVDCLCFKEIQKCVESLEAPSVCFARSRKLNTTTGCHSGFCNNLPGTVQCCLTDFKTDGRYDQMQKI